MKKLGAFALLLSLAVFSLGCEKKDAGGGAAPAPETTDAGGGETTE